MRSLRFRLTVWFSLAVTLTAGTAAGIGFFVVRKQMHDGIDFLLAAEIEEIVQRIGRDSGDLPTESLLETVRRHVEIDAPLFFFQITRPGEGVVFRSRNLGDFSLPDAGADAQEVRTIMMRDEPLRVRIQDAGTYRIEVATALNQVESLLGRYGQLLLGGLPLLFLVSLLVGWVLSNVALAPVRAMQRAAQRIGASNLAERLPVPAGRDEIASLARLLNELFDRLESAFDQVRRFTADASHELKTPLSLIRLHAERLAASPTLTTGDRVELEGQIEEIHRLNKLIESLLLLARADARSLPLDLRAHDRQRFIAEFAEDAAALAEDRGLSVAVEQADEGPAVFDTLMWRQALLNVLSNAVRYSPPGGRISICSTTKHGSWVLQISDEGPGVPPAQLEQIFGRFVRGPGAEHHSPGGSGLGLSIARSIVEAHGGTIAASNNAPRGLSVTITLPVVPREDSRWRCSNGGNVAAGTRR